MGEHKGWRVREEPKVGTWRGLVRHKGGYKSKSFPTAAEARKWAKEQASLVAIGRPSVALEAGRALVSALRVDYLQGLVARGRSPSHLRNVTRTIDRLGEVAPDLAADTAGRAIERWLDGMKVSPATRNRSLVEVRAFCRWAIRRDLLAKDPTRAIERASVPDYLRPQFTVAEIRAILATDHRFRLHFALMTLAGLRSGEAAGLRWSDVDRASGILLVRLHGHRVKRNKERIVPLLPTLAALLGEARGPDARVAPVLSEPAARKAWVSLLKAAGVAKGGRSPHACRHTYAGLMTATGLPGPLLGAYLGHSAAETTMLYTKLAARYAQDPEVRGWGRGLLFPGHLPGL